jgi:hypothetical protein
LAAVSLGPPRDGFSHSLAEKKSVPDKCTTKYKKFAHTKLRYNFYIQEQQKHVDKNGIRVYSAFIKRKNSHDRRIRVRPGGSAKFRQTF